MPIVSIVIGGLLVGLGVYGYTTADTRSVTALIPAFVGGPLILCGLLALKESLLKHAMHAAAMFGVIGLLGAIANLARVASKDGIDLGKTSAQSTVAMGGLCALFVALCINSFIQARKRRAAREAI